MQQINEKVVAALPTPAKGNKVYFFSGATLQGKKAPSGFGVRVTAAGTKSFVLFHRADGRKYLETLGRWDDNAQGGTLTVRDAVIAAAKLTKGLKSGRREDPRPERTRRLQDANKPEGLTIDGLLDSFVERYTKKEAGLRIADEIERTFERLVKPRIGKVGIHDLKRSQVVDMLDDIADQNGPVMADRVLAFTRKAFNWYAARDDDFTPPIVKGMSRTKTRERARKRVLADDEIRDLWTALDRVADVPTCFPRYVKMLLFTAARRNEVANMHASELTGDSWTIPGARYKTKLDHVIPLTTEALTAIGEIKKDTRFVFSSDEGKTAFSGFSKAKRALDTAITKVREESGREPMATFTFHDLRRTARSLLSRAKVPPDRAERCLGHVIGGVRGIYDRHAFFDEKRAAFEELATMVNAILHPPTSNVIQFPGA